MYAVIVSGGKQYRVTEGETIKVSKLEGEPGSLVTFDEVLLTANDEDIKIGTPVVEGVKVAGEIVNHGRGKKIEIIKFKRRKHHIKHQGHRQDFTAVKITSLTGQPKEAAVKEEAVKSNEE
ncbi:MAG: 50S ribosomal protein L21 [Gammaproteobacteria bacterium]|nr:50S ribosomal protein L21 [Gammaproteobacteria bacterium]